MLKNKGIGYWMCTAAAVIALALAVVLFLFWKDMMGTSINDGYIVAIVLLVAVAVHVGFSFISVRFAAVPAVALYMTAFCLLLLRIADAVTYGLQDKGNISGGNATACITVAVFVLICALISVIACFFSQRKEEKYLI